MSTFQSNIISIYGEKGKAWLDELSELVAAIALRLDLRDLKEVTNLTYNYVLSGLQGDNPIILKLGLDNAGLKREALALKCFAGYGAVTVLSEDDLPDEALAKAGGILLLERAVPGASLKRYFPDREQESIEIACGVMQKLHQANIPTTHNFPHIKDWLKALDRDCLTAKLKCTRSSYTKGARLGRNPKTMQEVIIPARKVVRFEVAPSLKKRINDNINMIKNNC